MAGLVRPVSPARPVVALVPVKDGDSTIGATVAALHAAGIERVVVVDDGSVDDSANCAEVAGAEVVRLGDNQGKGGALQAGLAYLTGCGALPSPGGLDSDDDIVLLLVDADTGDSAGAAVGLLALVQEGAADLVIGVLPSAGGRGGFGAVRRLAGWGIRRACGLRTRAPLSGQRAVRAGLLRRLTFAPRFGVEVAMTIDAVRCAARVVEVDVAMEHRHRGRKLDGFAHRAKQGRDIAQALWPRLVPRRLRQAGFALVLAAVLLGELAVAGVHQHQAQKGTALPAAAAAAVAAPVKAAMPVKVVVVPGATWSDVPDGDRGPCQCAAGSVVTGPLDTGSSVVHTLEAASRDSGAMPLSDVHVEVVGVWPAILPSPQVAVSIVVGVDLPHGPQMLRPLLITGPGMAGTLTSASTHQTGVVDLSDLAPTVLSLEGKAIPSAVTGNPLHQIAGNPGSPPGPEFGFSQLRARALMVHFYDRLRPPVILVYVLIQVALYLTAMAAATRRSVRLLGGYRKCGYLGLAIAAFPLACYFTRWLIGTRDVGIGGWSALSAVVVGIIVVMARHTTRTFPAALQRVFGVTMVLLLADVLAGTPLQVSGIFGSSPAAGGRYYGLGNPAAIVLLEATILWAALWVQRAATAAARESIVPAAAVIMVMAVADGLGGLGSDVGGGFAFVVTGAVLLALLWPGVSLWRSFRWMAMGIAAAATALLVFAAVDYSRPTAQRTHLGRLAARVMHQGPQPLVDTVSHKLHTNLLGYGFPWSLGVLAVAGLMLGGLMAGYWQLTLPPGSPVRAGAIAALLGGFVSYFVNDSGIVVLALTAVAVGPYVLVLYLQSVQAQHVQSPHTQPPHAQSLRLSSNSSAILKIGGTYP